MINLSWNGFADDGAAVLAKALASNETLLQLDVSCNRISTDGLVLLAEGIKANRRLTVLKVQQVIPVSSRYIVISSN